MSLMGLIMCPHCEKRSSQTYQMESAGTCMELRSACTSKQSAQKIHYKLYVSAGVQPDLNLCWSNMSEGTFSGELPTHNCLGISLHAGLCLWHLMWFQHDIFTTLFSLFILSFTYLSCQCISHVKRSPFWISTS